MKIAFSALLMACVAGVSLAQTPAHAAALPSKPHVGSIVSSATFWVDHDKKKHAHASHHKHRVAQLHAQHPHKLKKSKH